MMAQMKSVDALGTISISSYFLWFPMISYEFTWFFLIMGHPIQAHQFRWVFTFRCTGWRRMPSACNRAFGMGDWGKGRGHPWRLGVLPYPGERRWNMTTVIITDPYFGGVFFFFEGGGIYFLLGGVPAFGREHIPWAGALLWEYHSNVSLHWLFFFTIQVTKRTYSWILGPSWGLGPI